MLAPCNFPALIDGTITFFVYASGDRLLFYIRLVDTIRPLASLKSAGVTAILKSSEVSLRCPCTLTTRLPFFLRVTVSGDG